MRVAEAQAIGAQLVALDAASLSPCLNLGSSTGGFREGVPEAETSLLGGAADPNLHQPQIQAYVIGPLEARGIKVLHADIKEGEGVDLVGDVYDPAYRERVKAAAPRLVICSNMLEHLPDRDSFVAFCREVVTPGGYVLVTVPRSYPYHPDPIDTGYRPTPDELAALFPGFDVIWKQVVADTTYWTELKQMPLVAWPRFLVSQFVKFPYLALAKRSRFLARYHRWLWLFRRYSVSCLLVRRPAIS